MERLILGMYAGTWWQVLEGTWWPIDLPCWMAINAPNVEVFAFELCKVNIRPIK